MLKDILPSEIFMQILQNFNLRNVYEIRIRASNPIYVNVSGIIKPLISKETNELVCADLCDIEAIIKRATQYSLYAYNDQMKCGYITCRGGIRIGLAGEHVQDASGTIKTVKNINSLNIRIPHEINNCAHTALTYILSGGIKSTLIISPPGAGKTTYLRDIVSHLSYGNKIYNVLVCDERFEIASCVNGVPMLNVGKTTDVISGATKAYAFSEGIRSLSPDVMVCDELITPDDILACEKSIRSGVKIIASLHGNSIDDVIKSPIFAEATNKKFFERYIVLSSKNGPGTIEGIYDQNFKMVFRGN